MPDNETVVDPVVLSVRHAIAEWAITHIRMWADGTTSGRGLMCVIAPAIEAEDDMEAQILAARVGATLRDIGDGDG